MTGTRTTLSVLLLAMTLASCGSGSHFSDRRRPSAPVEVSVYVNDQRVSVSPSAVTPGATTFTITNQSSSAESIEVSSPGASHAITTTGPISPQANDQVTVDLPAGQYSVGIAPASSTQAAAATPAGIMSGSLTVQGNRPSFNNQLLQP